MDRPAVTSAEAAARLGVKLETLYAYVSRGLLTSHRAADGRSSRFDATEVEALAERARRGGRAGGLELIVASSLTLIEGDRLFYRGVDVADIVPAMEFEDVAEWLWTGAEMGGGPHPGWDSATVQINAPGIRVVDRLRILVATAAAGDDLRYDLAPAAVATAGRRMLASMVDGLPLVGPAPAGTRLAERLLPRLGRLDPSLVDVVNAVLALLADHELAASTLAARVAASVRADPYSVVSTGLGVIAGALHGAANRPVVSLFEDVGSPNRAARVIGDRLAQGERIPGLGHKVYRQVDPRCEILLGLLRQRPTARWETVESVLALVRERIPVVVNVDFALGAFAWAFDLDAEAADSLFGIARTAGWLAHALEEYDEPAVRFRPRAIYTGPRPPS